MVPNGEVLSVGFIPPGNPLTSQATPVSPVLITVAVKGCVVPVAMVMVWGDTLTATPAREPLLSGAAPTPPQLTRATVALNTMAIKRPIRVFFNMPHSQFIEPLLPR